MTGATGLRLSPHYDLVSTEVYPALERRLAMKIGAARVGCAEGYGESPVYDAIERICERQASGLDRELVRAGR
jgi:hypothetical protein